MSAVEQQIMNRLQSMPLEDQDRVLRFIDFLERKRQPYPGALELMNMPPEERERLVAEAFVRAVDEEFEVFEAYSEEAIYDES